MSGCAASHSKLLASHQHQIQQAKLLAVVDKSHAPIDKSHIQYPMAPAMLSSIDCTNHYNQRSAKKLLKQAIIIIAAITVSPIAKLPSVPKLPPVVK
jgi:hypothetical protein